MTIASRFFDPLHSRVDAIQEIRSHSTGHGWMPRGSIPQSDTHESKHCRGSFRLDNMGELQAAARSYGRSISARQPLVAADQPHRDRFSLLDHLLLASNNFRRLSFPRSASDLIVEITMPRERRNINS